MPPQQTPRASWPSRDDNGGFFLIVSVIGLIVLGVIWWINKHGPISSAIMTAYHYQIAALHHLTDRFDVADQQMARANPENVSLEDLYGIAHAVGAYVSIPAALLLVALGAVCMVRAAPSRFKRQFDVDALVKEQIKSFPTTAAFGDRHLKLEPPKGDIRPLDFALTPDEWIERHGLRSGPTIDETLTRHAFARQLGPRWLGVDTAEPHVRAVFAVFALHLAERRAEALELLGVMSAALASAGADEPSGPAKPLPLPSAVNVQAAAVLQDVAVFGPAAKIASNHAYTHTALMGLLNASRLKGGVLAPGQFAWLKLVDRTLWYALHSLGFEAVGFGRYLHPNPRIEAAGARDHWAAEVMVDQPIVRPDVERAVAALRQLVEGGNGLAKVDQAEAGAGIIFN